MGKRINSKVGGHQRSSLGGRMRERKRDQGEREDNTGGEQAGYKLKHQEKGWENRKEKIWMTAMEQKMEKMVEGEGRKHNNLERKGWTSGGFVIVKKRSWVWMDGGWHEEKVNCHISASDRRTWLNWGGKLVENVSKKKNKWMMVSSEAGF